MIRNEKEYQEALRRINQDRQLAEAQRSALKDMGLTRDEVQRAMEPMLSFHAQLSEEVAWYENARRRSFPEMRGLTQIGRLLIALRIANGLTQQELARRLNVSEAAVSRDENNEYHGITIDRAQRILDALNALVTVKVEAPLAKAS